MKQYGSQRHIHMQLYLNSRRRKRRGKKLKQHTLSELERVVYVFMHGKIKDYTHPKEIDPYWDNLYKQFEFLNYVEFYYRKILKSIKNVDDILLKETEKDFNVINDKKELLVHYMMNYMNLLYGSVMSSRFYGWFRHIELFIGRFNIDAMRTLRRLQFDVNKTRCSVYYFQVFWLSGLGLTKQISNNVYHEILFDSHTKNQEQNKTIEKNFADEESEELFNTIMENIEDEGIQVEAPQTTELSIEEEIEKENEEISISPFEKEQEQIVEKLEETHEIDVEDEIIEQETETTMRLILSNLLKKLNISLDYIYTAKENELERLGKYIKQKIERNEIKLTSVEKEIIKQHFDIE